MGRERLARSVTAAWILILAGVFARSFWVDETGIWVGHEHQWADWPLHLGMIRRFAVSPATVWFLHHPMFAYGQASYPFGMNLISGLLMRCGCGIWTSVIGPMMVAIVLFVGGLHAVMRRMLRTDAAAALGVSLFLLSSGPGWWRYLVDLSRGGPIVPGTFYTRIDAFNWYSGNVVAGLLLPQRSFLAGITVGTLALLCLLKAMDASLEALPRSRRYALPIFGGFLAGILPVVHPHSALVLAAVLPIVALSRKDAWRQSAVFAAVATPLAAALYLTFIAAGVSGQSFFAWLPGWSAGPDFFRWLGMWWQLWGLSLPLAGLGLWLLWKDPVDRSAKGAVLGLLLAFLAANLFLVQTVHWDNSKIFFWSFIAVAALDARALVWLAAFGRRGTVAAAVLGAALAGTGVLDMARLVQMRRNPLLLVSAEERDLAERLASETAPDAIFATDSSHNHIVMSWAARPILLGFTPWVRNFGFDPMPREADLNRILEAREGPVEAIKRLKVSYVYFGPAERRRGNEAFYKENFPVAFDSPTATVYDVR